MYGPLASTLYQVNTVQVRPKKCLFQDPSLKIDINMSVSLLPAANMPGHQLKSRQVQNCNTQGFSILHLFAEVGINRRHANYCKNKHIFSTRLNSNSEFIFKGNNCVHLVNACNPLMQCNPGKTRRELLGIFVMPPVAYI